MAPSWFTLAAALLMAAAAPGAADDALIVKPLPGKSGDPAAWIVLPGAEIPKEAYGPLAEAVQKGCSMPLWVAVLGTYLTPTPIPPELGSRIDYVLGAMKAQGLDLSKTKLFYGGHSLGSVFIQDHLYSYHGPTGPLQGSVKVLGQVLMGGFIQRKYAYPSWSYPVTTLTLGGELDGLARPTRLAEAYYQAQNVSNTFPVVILPGVTHMQFAAGAPPLLVKARDLQPEISADEAHTAMAEAIAPYFERLAGLGGGQGDALASLRERTREFLTPIIAAYEKEGARYLGTPVQFGGPSESQCVVDGDKGACPSASPWAPMAQRVISDIEGWSLSLSNQFVSLSSTPLGGGAFHLPKITNNSDTHVISITTFSQNYWDDAQPSWFDWKEIFDSFDTGFVATSALEIGTKLASRQCTYIFGAGKANTSFDVDSPNFCAKTNQKAYDWALQQAGAATKARFDSYGQRYTFGDDIPKQGGPLWLYARLAFDEQSKDVVQVSSPMQKTEIDYWARHFGPIPRPSIVPDPGCYHYCKLLSPARAMEWIYVDSLRRKRGLGAAVGGARLYV